MRATQDITSYYKFAVCSVAELAASEAAEDTANSIHYQLWQRHLTHNLTNFWRALIYNRKIHGRIPPQEWQIQFKALVLGAWCIASLRNYHL
jgi:hypothetical protein